MRVLAIDPGKTSGYVILERFPTDEDSVLILEYWQDTDPLEKRVRSLLYHLRNYRIQIVVVEDYRIYESHKGHHVGAHLLTPEYIGAIKAVCALMVAPLICPTLPASKKGRWPDARLDAKFPQHTEVHGQHARDALKIGLAYLESRGWKP